MSSTVTKTIHSHGQTTVDSMQVSRQIVDEALVQSAGSSANMHRGIEAELGELRSNKETDND